MNKKIVMALLAIVAIAILAVASTLVVPSTSTQEIVEHGYIDGYVTFEKNGIVFFEGHNTLMTSGAEGIMDALNSTSGANVTYIAVGNGTTPDADSTTLDSEITDCGLERNSGTFTLVNQTSWSYHYTWTSTCDDVEVNTSAMFNDNSAGTMFWGAAFDASTTLQSSDTLRGLWNLTVSGA